MGKHKQLAFSVLFLLMISCILSCSGNDDKKINIIGKITLNGAGLAGVQANIAGIGAQTTDTVGTYVFNNVIP